ncbi:sugar ABC transporter substrate-binding protein [Acrocarpospora phusangensis]|uniref:Sugar ABC transporter substrate-binding protein n=1 Tax=Acrocarpospora phusangensis TaxID=1070424 RepID=A0A919Q9I9_9ACTN|nr:maltose ABC transporter substrate-binding protein [Acrocarpospora phusangensis]GIH23679.1 sugar ABC transporter substrate-binding protein [Acrocarpospora phusangensis]
MRLSKVSTLAAGVTLLLTAGCGGGGETAAPSAAATTTGPAPGATTIVEPTDGPVKRAQADLVIWADDTRSPIIQKIAQKFATEKGVQVAVQQLEFGDIRDNLVTAGQAGEGPDVVIGAHDWLGKLVTNGAVAPIELGDKTSQFKEVALKALSYDGQLYGLPYAIENIALFRNVALAPEAPKDWNALMDNALKLVKEKKATVPLGLQVGPEGDPYHFYPVHTSFGSGIFATKPDGSYDPSQLLIDDAGGLEFAKALESWSKKKLLSADLTLDIAKEAFNTGKSPYMITGPWSTEDAQKAGIDLAVDPIPSAGGKPAAPFVGVQGFMISANAKNKLVANDFVVNYLGTPEVMKELYDTGKRPPAMISVYDQVKGDPIIAGFGAAGDIGQPLPSIPAMDAVWTEYGHAERDILLGKGDPEKLMKQAAEKIRAKIG